MTDALQLIDDYWDDSVEDPDRLIGLGHGEENDPNDPGRFSLKQQGPRFVLPVADGSLLSLVSRSWWGERPAGHAATQAELATLLHFSLGIARFDLGEIQGWPYHRFVPSARCLSSTELYLMLPYPLQNWPAGIYHFDPAHHHLVLVREGSHGLRAHAALGEEENLEATLILTSVLWKTAFRYRHYAYRLCTQEAGAAVGNAETVARSLAFGVRTQLDINDREVEDLIGLDPNSESSVAAIALTRHRKRSQSPPVPGKGALFPRPTQSPPRVALAGRAYAAMHASRSSEPSEALPAQVKEPSTPKASTAHALNVGLEQALQERSSGGSVFRVVPPELEGLSILEWAQILGPAPSSDIAVDPGYNMLLAPVAMRGDTAILTHGNETESLHYGLTEETLRSVVRGAPIIQAQALQFAAYVLIDRDKYRQAYGQRSYRLAHVQAGIGAMRLCIAAAAYGLSARIVNAYSAAHIRKIFGLPDRYSPLFQIFVGRRSHGGQYEIGTWT